MKLTVDRLACADVLAQAQKYVAGRITIPILTTVLLRAADDRIEITTTDLDHEFRATVEAEVETDGTVAVNAALLASFARGAAGTRIDLALDGSMLHVHSGAARCRMPTLPADDFPKLFRSAVVAHSFEMDGAELGACRAAVGYAISDEKGRLYLNGTCWSIEHGRLEFAATDGHILSLVNIELPAGAAELRLAIVPDITLPTFAGMVRIELGETFIRFAGMAGHSLLITSKLIDGNFPAYRRIIHEPTVTALVERKQLAAAVGRCLALCKASQSPLDLIHDLQGELIVRVLATDGASIEDRIAIEGAMFAVSLGGALLAATLDSFAGETIEIGLTGIGENVRFCEPGNDHRLAVIMPVRGTLTHRVGPTVAQLNTLKDTKGERELNTRLVVQVARE